MFVASLWWKAFFSQKPYLFFALDFIYIYIVRGIKLRIFCLPRASLKAGRVKDFTIRPESLCVHNPPSHKLPLLIMKVYE